MTSRVALVTGAADGIGAAVARRLARGGMRVLLADLDAERGAAVAAETGGLFVRADVSGPEANRAVVAEGLSAYGRLDVAVLNAGIAGRCNWHDFTPAAYRATMAADLDSVVYGIDACLPELRRTSGAVVVTASLAGLTAAPDPFYAAAKHALIGLVRSTAMLLDGVTVNALCPGLTDTAVIAGFRDDLLGHGLLLAAPDEAAVAVETILADGRTGQAWVVQAGVPAWPVSFPDFPLAIAD